MRHQTTSHPDRHLRPLWSLCLLLWDTRLCCPPPLQQTLTQPQKAASLQTRQSCLDSVSISLRQLSHNRPRICLGSKGFFLEWFSVSAKPTCAAVCDTGVTARLYLAFFCTVIHLWRRDDNSALSAQQLVSTDT